MPRRVSRGKRPSSCLLFSPSLETRRNVQYGYLVYDIIPRVRKFLRPVGEYNSSTLRAHNVNVTLINWVLMKEKGKLKWEWVSKSKHRLYIYIYSLEINNEIMITTNAVESKRRSFVFIWEYSSAILVLFTLLPVNYSFLKEEMRYNVRERSMKRFCN